MIRFVLLLFALAGLGAGIIGFKDRPTVRQAFLYFSGPAATEIVVRGEGFKEAAEAFVGERRCVISAGSVQPRQFICRVEGAEAPPLGTPVRVRNFLSFKSGAVPLAEDPDRARAAAASPSSPSSQ